MEIKVFAFSLLVTGALAQNGGWGGGSNNPALGARQSMWGQCGGRTYTGPVACPTGAYCRFDGNEWYQQCVPNNYPNHNDPPNNDSPGNPGIVTRTITTVFTIDVPRPMPVTTFITYLQPTTTPIRTTLITLTPDEPWRPME